MKKLLLSTTLLALTAGAALAADLPTRKEPLLPPPPPPPMWTGFYVGLNAGGTWANSNQQTIAVGPVASDPGSIFNPAFPLFAGGNPTPITFSSVASASGANQGNGGFIGGGQIGYKWQVMNSFVAGLEADIQGVASSGGGRTGISSSVINPNAPGTNWIGVTSARGNLQYLGTVRGQLGWLATPTLLLYGTGGLAYGGVSLNTATAVYNDVPANPFVNVSPAFGGVNYSNTQVGWTAGGGIEWMFMQNWSAKVEYLYYDLGTVTQNFSMAVGSSVTIPGEVPITATGNAIFGGQARARINGNIVRAGVNYHFNWGAAPVVAKY